MAEKGTRGSGEKEYYIEISKAVKIKVSWVNSGTA